MSRPRKHPLPTFAQVAAKLRYDPLTGEFERHTKTGFCPVALTVQNLGYRVIGLRLPLPSMYLAHRLAWLLTYGEWPSGELDHRDGNKLDNRISNLRLATRNQNCSNIAAYNRNGYKGTKLKPSGRFGASIRFNGISVYLGTFDTAKEAGHAYNQAARKLHADFANTMVIVRGTIAASINITSF